ncbi:MAG: hypothetical protein ABIG92_03165 [Candidatus Omnitrophota bacterium]
MKKYFFILTFFCIFIAGYGFSEEIEIDSEIISIDLDSEFFIIDSGEDKFVEIGDGVVIHRDGEKIGEGYVVEVRPTVSAVEILDILEDETVEEGDGTLIVKDIAASKDKSQKKSQPPAKRSKWASLIGKSEETNITTTPTAQEKSLAVKPKKSQWATLLGADNSGTQQGQVTSLTSVSRGTLPAAQSRLIQPQLSEKGESVFININRDPKIVFSYARLVLRENGYTIESSSRTSGLIIASKPIELSLIKELWSDIKSEIGHNVVFSIEIKQNNASSTLTAMSFKEHTQKNKYLKRGIAKNSKYYNELVSVISIIKERSEL